MNARVKGISQYRKPSLCECGRRMTLQLVHDFWALRCDHCGATSAARIPAMRLAKA